MSLRRNSMRPMTVQRMIDNLPFQDCCSGGRSRAVLIRHSGKAWGNRWLDALYNACAAGHLCGVRLLDSEPSPQPPARRDSELSPQDDEPVGV